MVAWCDRAVDLEMGCSIALSHSASHVAGSGVAEIKCQRHAAKLVRWSRGVSQTAESVKGGGRCRGGDWKTIQKRLRRPTKTSQASGSTPAGEAVLASQHTTAGGPWPLGGEAFLNLNFPLVYFLELVFI